MDSYYEIGLNKLKINDFGSATAYFQKEYDNQGTMANDAMYQIFKYKIHNTIDINENIFKNICDDLLQKEYWKIYKLLTLYYFNSNRIDLAIKYSITGSNYNINQCTLFLFWTYMKEKDFIKIIYYFNKIIKFKYVRIEDYYNIANIYNYQQIDFNKAIIYYKKVIETPITNNNYKYYNLSLIKLANMLHIIFNDNSCEKYYKEFSINNINEDYCDYKLNHNDINKLIKEYKILKCYEKIGQLYISQNNFDKAIKYYSKIYPIPYNKLAYINSMKDKFQIN